MKKNKIQILKKSGVQVALDNKERYNPYACGHGVIGDIKYNREKERKKIRREIIDNL